MNEIRFWSAGTARCNGILTGYLLIAFHEASLSAVKLIGRRCREITLIAYCFHDALYGQPHRWKSRFVEMKIIEKSGALLLHGRRSSMYTLRRALRHSFIVMRANRKKSFVTTYKVLLDLWLRFDPSMKSYFLPTILAHKSEISWFIFRFGFTACLWLIWRIQSMNGELSWVIASGGAAILHSTTLCWLRFYVRI